MFINEPKLWAHQESVQNTLETVNSTWNLGEGDQVSGFVAATD